MDSVFPPSSSNSSSSSSNNDNNNTNSIDAAAETLEKILSTIDAAASKRIKEGFSPVNFTAGVLNCLLVAFVFGAFPQHFWLLYIVEALYLIPTKIVANYRAKPLNEVLFYLDYCWVMNILGTFLLIVLAVAESVLGWTLSTYVRKQIYLTVVGVSCGPLLGATMLLPFVAVVFHDVMTMTNLFIHIYPPMLMYTFLWHAHDIHAAWPHIFGLDYIQDIDFVAPLTTGNRILSWLFPRVGSIAGNALTLYFVWFIPYVLWMLLVGLDLPRKNRRRRDGTRTIVPKFDTVFHATVRHGLYATFGTTFWNRPVHVSQAHMQNDDYEQRDFLLYMTIHATFSYLSTMLLASGCFYSQYCHAAWLIVLTVLCVHRGSLRYTYWVTTMYGRLVRRQSNPTKED